MKSLPASFSASIPDLDGLDAVVNRSAGRLKYEPASETLTVAGALDEGIYRALLRCCGGHERRTELEGSLRDLRDRSALYIGDDELQSLETFARRMRGEIFFAERWLIVEGQADYLIVHAMAHAMGYNLDSHGVSVIDAQNNGNPATFAALARALDIPWLAVFDGDNAGKDYVEAIAKRGFSDAERAELTGRCQTDLEAQLVSDGLGPELREILAGLGVAGAQALVDEALPERLRADKTGFAAVLAARIRAVPDLAQRAPAAFRTAINELRGLA